MNELASLWLAGGDRNEITTATNVSDHELGTDAELKGESVSEGFVHSVLRRCVYCSQYEPTIESQKSY